LDSVPHEATRFDVTGEAAGMKYQEHGIRTGQTAVALRSKRVAISIQGAENPSLSE
jgi:hypothetical protein